jgi:putative hydrolase of the HAD superfamily
LANTFFNTCTPCSPKGLLLDLDDTIVTDDAVSEKTWQTVCAKFAPSMGNTSPDILYEIIRNVAKQYWKDWDNHRKGRLSLEATRRRLVRLAVREIGFSDDILADRIADTYTVEKELAIAPVPGALEALRSLKAGGLRLALVTNGGSDVQRRKIERFGLDSFFDFILVEGEFGLGKPHPDVFKKAMAELKLEVSETWMVGDDLERDIAGAQGVDVYSIWIDWKESGLPSNSSVYPQFIIRDLKQLPRLIHTSYY